MADRGSAKLAATNDASTYDLDARKEETRGFTWKLVAAILWLTFSVALAIWWLIFGLKQIDRITALGGTAPEGLAAEIARQHRMLLSEGGTLIVLLLAGGVALLYYMSTEVRRARRLRHFFAAFTHDLKTSIASLRLQAESLAEDMAASAPAEGSEKLLRRLVKDTVRLELQLENSLLLASPEDSSRLFIESIDLVTLLRSLSHQWPELTITIDGAATVTGDQRALESIFKNLFQNAVVHGRAKNVRVGLRALDGRVLAHVEDDGRGFQGDQAQLGRMFARHGSTSGSGLGLYLASRMSEAQGGGIRFCKPEPQQKGFCVEVLLEGTVGKEARS